MKKILPVIQYGAAPSETEEKKDKSSPRFIEIPITLPYLLESSTKRNPINPIKVR
jgi:hypothetical protein